MSYIQNVPPLVCFEHSYFGIVMCRNMYEVEQCMYKLWRCYYFDNFLAELIKVTRV